MSSGLQATVAAVLEAYDAVRPKSAALDEAMSALRAELEATRAATRERTAATRARAKGRKEGNGNAGQ